MSKPRLAGAAVSLVALPLLAGCGGARGQAGSPDVLPAAVAAYDAASMAPIEPGTLLERLRSADFLLLGELHDNPVHHETRGRLITALAARRPAVVFEQFAASDAPIPPPPGGVPDTAWLDRHGFDRRGWRWPLHRPAVTAALASARSIWGSNLPRESLSSVIRSGAGALPVSLQQLMAAAPPDSAVIAIMTQELVDGHCGGLPASMAGGMRTAQEARDAAMARAMISAGAGGPVILIAGNGHVRADVAVPRILRRVAPERSVLVVGLVEQSADGGPPPPAARVGYDVVLVTPRADRPDPCAAFRARGP